MKQLPEADAKPHLPLPERIESTRSVEALSVGVSYDVKLECTAGPSRDAAIFDEDTCDALSPAVWFNG